MKKNIKGKNYIKSFIVGACLLLTGCGTIGLAQEAAFESAYENTPEEEEKINIYTSEGCGIVEKVDTVGQKITVYMINRKEERTFSYDMATVIWDRHGSGLTMEQLLLGEVADLSYNDELEQLGSITISPEAWSYDAVEKYSLNESKGTVQIGDDTYSLGKNIKVFSGDQQLETSQILKQDVLSFRGIGHEVVSVIVEKGHGYLDLSGEEALIGGWIEVGQTVITQITADMLIAVPEGTYTVRITAGDIDESREVMIERNKETVLNLGDIEIAKPISGKIVFAIEPADAQVYIDDIKVDTSYTIKLPLGIHKVTASASGYDTMSEYFEVKEETTTVSMTLQEAEETDTVSGNQAEEEGNHTITIKTPENAEVYQDNLYMGIAPVTYTKTAGDHVITLRKTGYVTTSYNVYIDDDEKDVVYSFPNLELESDASKTSSQLTVSGNTVSGNSSSQTTVSGNQTTVSSNN